MIKSKNCASDFVAALGKGIKHVFLCVLFLLLSLAASAPVFADEISIAAGACAGQTVTSGHASVNCTAVQDAFNTASYFDSGTLNGPVTGSNPPGSFSIGASAIELPSCSPAAGIGCGSSTATSFVVIYNFGGLGLSSGMAQFNFAANGAISGPLSAAEFEVTPGESLSVNGVPVGCCTAQLPNGITRLTVNTPITNGASSLQFTIVASAGCSGIGSCQSVVSFADPITITGASAYDGSGNLVPGVTFVSESGFNPNVQPTTYSCQGFQPPFSTPISIKHNTQRAIPLQAQLFDSSGILVTPAVLGSAQAPVVNVTYTASSGTAVDETNVLDPLGQSSSGNVFNFDTTSNTWWFNLATSPFTASGTYTVTLQSGNVNQYSVSPQCSGTFVRQ